MYETINFINIFVDFYSRISLHNVRGTKRASRVDSKRYSQQADESESGVAVGERGGKQEWKKRERKRVAGPTIERRSRGGEVGSRCGCEDDCEKWEVELEGEEGSFAPRDLPSVRCIRRDTQHTRFPFVPSLWLERGVGAENPYACIRSLSVYPSVGVGLMYKEWRNLPLTQERRRLRRRVPRVKRERVARGFSSLPICTMYIAFVSLPPVQSLSVLVITDEKSNTDYLCHRENHFQTADWIKTLIITKISGFFFLMSAI